MLLRGPGHARCCVGIAPSIAAALVEGFVSMAPIVHQWVPTPIVFHKKQFLVIHFFQFLDSFGLKTMRSLFVLLGLSRRQSQSYVSGMMSACLGIPGETLKALLRRIQDASGSVAAMCPLGVKARAPTLHTYKLDLVKVYL